MCSLKTRTPTVMSVECWLFQTGSSQSANWGAETCAKLKSTSPCLLAIPAFDRIPGLYNRQLISNRGICLRYLFLSQAEGLE